MRNGNYILLEDSTDPKAISTPNEFEAERRICVCANTVVNLWSNHIRAQHSKAKKKSIKRFDYIYTWGGG